MIALNTSAFSLSFTNLGYFTVVNIPLLVIPT